MKSIAILSFLYNDWESAEELFHLVGIELNRRQWSAKLVLIDDGSFVQKPPGFLQKPTGGFTSVDLITLRTNMGHQRAIAIALSHLLESGGADSIVVMDCDGEDRPEDLIRLMEAFDKLQQSRIIFAERTRRTEGVMFRLFYQIYRMLHYVLSGYRIRFGNFSVIPGAFLPRLTVDPNLWLHYAATVVAGGIPHTSIPTQRGVRLHGKSTLNFTKLVVHGLTAISCYNEIVCVRLLLGLLFLAGALGIALAIVVVAHLFISLAIPAWAIYIAEILVIVMMQALLVCGPWVFFALSARKAGFPLPIEHYKIYIHAREQIRQGL
jgi:hypothetical protein